jgi:hypothetical protein
MNDAIQNAAHWYETIKDQLARLRDACDSGEDEAYETIREEIQDSPLSVQVRSDWHDVGGSADPSEFCILLSTGGPALRIVGTLGTYNVPEGSRLEWQHWGTPWTECTFADSAILDSWAAQFWLGE